MNRYSEEDRDTHLELLRESGLSKQAYSKASGINYKTILRWSKSTTRSPKEFHPKKEEHFISMSLPDEDTGFSPDLIEVYYPTGVVVKLPIGTSLSLLKGLLG